MKNTKTQRDFYKEIIELAENAGKADVVEFANSRIALLDKKATSKGETAKQKENAEIKDLLVDLFANLGEKMVTVSEILKDYPEIAEKVNGSNQKLTALLTQLKKDNEIANVKEGKKSYYKAI
jgi:chromosome condensin MukBEF ATPase and DNA-binding subunit MukB